jgi:sec-independent protein translocase protein TatB
MFEVGFWELALIFVLGLVVLGPEKLPKVAAQLGRYAGQARRMARTLTAQIRDEIEAEERRITASESKPAPPEPSYNRPGADDLIPRTTAAKDTNTPPADARAENSADQAATRHDTPGP